MAANLTQLEHRIQQELAFTDYVNNTWVIPPDRKIVIVGAGMAGLAAAFSLKQANLSPFKLFDSYPSDEEGPWSHYARMKILRSTKPLTGPAQNFPLLTFRAWYEAQWGEHGWEKLGKIPTLMWLDYLTWFKKTLNLPVQNNTRLIQIEPEGTGLKLTLDHAGKTEQLKADKLILATGREGFGGARIPSFVQDLPKEYYAHTNENIDFAHLKNKRICIVGVGASAFDAAAVVLEMGAESVTMLMRRQRIPYINKAANLAYYGYFQGYYYLKDEVKLQFFSACREMGPPPPFEALERIQNRPNFTLKSQVQIQRVLFKNQALEIQTSQKPIPCDYLILGTGFNIDGYQQPELKPFMDQILLWKDKHPQISYGSFPYLGPHFEFLEKTPQSAPYLKHIYCFNYGATLSHGLISGDIPGIGIGAQRVARGVATDLFTENWPDYMQQLKDYQRQEFDERTYPWMPLSSSTNA